MIHRAARTRSGCVACKQRCFMDSEPRVFHELRMEEHLARKSYPYFDLALSGDALVGTVL